MSAASDPEKITVSMEANGIEVDGVGVIYSTDSMRKLGEPGSGIFRPAISTVYDQLDEQFFKDLYFLGKHLLPYSQFRNNWENAYSEEPRRFSKRILKRLNYRQAKKRLVLSAYWE